MGPSALGPGPLKIGAGEASDRGRRVSAQRSAIAKPCLGAGAGGANAFERLQRGKRTSTSAMRLRGHGGQGGCYPRMLTD